MKLADWHYTGVAAAELAAASRDGAEIANERAESRCGWFSEDAFEALLAGDGEAFARPGDLTDDDTLRSVQWGVPGRRPEDGGPFGWARFTSRGGAAVARGTYLNRGRTAVVATAWVRVRGNWHARTWVYAGCSPSWAPPMFDTAGASTTPPLYLVYPRLGYAVDAARTFGRASAGFAVRTQSRPGAWLVFADALDDDGLTGSDGRPYSEFVRNVFGEGKR